MCAPPVLALAAAGLAATGTITSGIAASQQANYQAKVADANARQANQQTADAIQRSVLDRQQLDRKYSNLQGQQQATMAANGIDLSFGSAGQVAADTTMLRNEDASALYKNENQEIKGYDISASNYTAQANADRAKASGAITSALFGAAGTALGGASQYSKLKGNGKGFG